MTARTNRHCANGCGNRLPSTSSLNRRYCSQACRQDAYRVRKFPPIPVRVGPMVPAGKLHGVDGKGYALCRPTKRTNGYTVEVLATIPRDSLCQRCYRNRHK